MTRGFLEYSVYSVVAGVEKCSKSMHAAKSQTSDTGSI